MYMYTPAIERFLPVQTQGNANVPCIRQQCRGDNYLGRSFERPG